MMVFPTSKKIRHAIQLLNQEKYSKSVGKCPIRETAGEIHMLAEHVRIKSIRSSDDENHRFVELDLLTQPCTHIHRASEGFP